MNVTYSDFSDDVGGVRSNFISALAAAANVTIDNVIINSISAEARRLRRLLSHYANVIAHSKDRLADSLRIQSALKQAIHLRNLRNRSEQKLVQATKHSHSHHPQTTHRPIQNQHNNRFRKGT